MHEYDAARGPAIYRGRTWKKPSGPPLRMTVAQADSLPPYVVIDRPMRFRAGALDVTIDPANLPQVGDGRGLLQRGDIVVLRMIADGWPDRPVHISRTTGNYARVLGLERNVLSQGLARRVWVPPAAPTRDTVLVEGLGWFDVARSHALWSREFAGPAAIQRRGDWVDLPSVNIPLTYLMAGGELAWVLRARGDSVSAARVMGSAAAVAKAVRQEGLLRDGGF